MGQKAGQIRRTDLMKLTATAHGITLSGINNNLPKPVYIDTVSSSVELADANDPQEQKALFVVDVIDANTLLLQQVGFLNATSHGLAVGNYYYIDPTTPGELTGTAPAFPDGNDICVYVVTADELLLIDNRRI